MANRFVELFAPRANNRWIRFLLWTGVVFTPIAVVAVILIETGEGVLAYFIPSLILLGLEWVWAIYWLRRFRAESRHEGHEH
ncbi:MAG: hypothetical protein KF742_01135 [Cryobacterium sp.]|nr:hypothetical protein [Cryobacterium sp.]